MISKEFIAEELQRLQAEICEALENEDGLGKFSVENWKREEGGGGVTRVLQHGNVIEKGGVNFSAVEGVLPEKIADALMVPAQDFFASGVSIVIHPYNPFVPIIHMNVRYFELSDGTYWFGGGIDLTPHYVNVDDAKYFHSQLKEVCDRYDEKYYPEFSNWADEYFFIKHRNETRGIGGIFFDRLSGEEHGGKEKLLEFILDVGRTFAPTYVELISRNRSKVFEDEHRQWQLIRRGRYVEFNLVYDKGTKFGLDTNGRIESILMSLPENASWIYDHRPAEGSEEQKTLLKLKKGLKWV